eukprot:CAMPEP_0184706128 /NCGR_PEP_ID=MMETSP0313-20130426/36600_1 /TAXON_ID=2792 /ORGANISM="Porphyridium aerugineum, Strain SAG 1380-2" /LENGTH=125 /DNA_ID=CAMNT_0027167673 /DNA_START=20 /DNA_END=397 /DNA_ORIENTATION=-
MAAFIPVSISGPLGHITTRKICTTSSPCRSAPASIRIQSKIARKSLNMSLSPSDFHTMVLLSANVEGDTSLYLKIFLGGLSIIGSAFASALLIGKFVGDNLDKLEEQYQEKREKELSFDDEEGEK